jgi:hypothetical protein
VPPPNPGQGKDRLENSAVAGRGPAIDQDMVGGPHVGPAESLGHFGGGIDPLGRGTGGEVGKGEAVVHAGDPVRE